MSYRFRMMSGKERDRFVRRLGALRGQLVETGPSKIEPNRKDGATSGVADGDEQALNEMMQILASSRNRKQGEELGKIDRALRKLADAPDTYGMCEECEEPIAKRRLELMPYVALCTECQAASDPKRGEGRRSLRDYKA